ncbi:MAG TPA: hypothetical protein VKY27_11430 [Bacteriovoracaceae bacterium]|nr:hypothetical protein [Bacteriovoracaceae bacterium]
MKKLMKSSMTKILLTCGVGIFITLAGFWHHQTNQGYLSTLHVMNQGLGTCFGRINQSFTAMMIKDVKSPYLDKGFAQLSNACLEELRTTFKPLTNRLPKVSESLNKLNSEAVWFYEKLGKIHSPMLLGQGMDGNLSPIQERYVAIEDLKVSLSDELDAGMHRIKQIQFTDEIIMGSGLLMFLLGLGFISLQEIKQIRKRVSAEKMAVNLINNNQANVGAMVDALVSKALVDQGLVVTAQIFKDYHESLLEGMHKQIPLESEMIPSESLKVKNDISTPAPSNVAEIKTPLQEVLNSLRSLNLNFESDDVLDIELKVEAEECSQILSTAIHKLNDRKIQGNIIKLSSELHEDRCIVNLFLANAAFNSEELEGSEDPSRLSDPYLMILSEMIKDSDITWSYGNHIDEKTNLMGMNFSFNFPRGTKVKNLISVVKGKKRDIARSLAN